MKKITLILMTLLIITSCGSKENNDDQKTIENKGGVENQKTSDDNSVKNVDEDSDLEKELMSDEDFKMHFSSSDDGQEIEAIMQKNGKNMSMKIIKMGKMEDAPENFKMKQMLLKDGFFYTNMQIGEKDIWLKGDYDQEKQENSGFIDVKKLLKKIKEENVKKESKEVEGKTYDCYSGEFLEDSEMCFEGENLKYILADGGKMKIIEFTNKVDKDAFITPSEDKITSQEELGKIMMSSMGGSENGAQ